MLADMCTCHLQALVNLVRGSNDAKRLIVLPAFETLPFKSKGNAAEDELTHRVAAFAQNADKAGLKVRDSMGTGSCSSQSTRRHRPGFCRVGMIQADFPVTVTWAQPSLLHNQRPHSLCHSLCKTFARHMHAILAALLTVNMPN